MQLAHKIYGTRNCANEKCKKEFEMHRVNQIYCSGDCCRETTNSRLLEKYHAKKAAINTIRVCKECKSKLSKYNKDKICHACQLSIENQQRIDLLAKLGIEYIDEDA